MANLTAPWRYFLSRGDGSGDAPGLAPSACRKPRLGSPEPGGPRRSPRLLHKHRAEQAISGPLGYLDLLPLEIKFNIFTHLPVEDLSVLTVTSKSMRNLVELYGGTKLAQSHLLPRSITHQVLPVSQEKLFANVFRQLGLLMKRSTCLYSTRDRLRLIQQFLQKYLCNFHKSCDSPRKCVALKCYGRFLHTVIAGWDDKELVKVFQAVAGNTLMIKYLNNIISSAPGNCSDIELHVRLFYRRVFIDQSRTEEERAFWLDLILKSLPMVHQAKVLFLLFGPVSADTVQWNDVCDTAPVSKKEADSSFFELACAFRTLHEHSKRWTAGDTVSVFKELTAMPTEWLSDNIAHLLYMCGQSITRPVLHSKAINGHIAEVANIVTSLCTVCHHHGEAMAWVVQIIISVLGVVDNSRDRFSLLHSIVDTFRDVIVDMHEYADAVDEGGAEFDSILEAQSQFYKDIMTLAFQQYLPHSPSHLHREQ